ncbi:hypothetical protein OZX57_00745 [Bifidobacterium sp. ESL0682]|uniref:hypothetical protein n=1 Tax=Bifidobacterium sp. ESL0682 TaxID=2983212 RepID=UPI0023F9ACC0|nr:hypothetical protein [Bifidobacterium sp. ESL0682]WEV42073.1 hypothetical protein OZX57_00745 [Bifidobacterium sp. ESL0682]
MANSNVGGVKFMPQYVYVVSTPGRGTRNAIEYQYADFSNPDYVTNIAAEQPSYMYANDVDTVSLISSTNSANGELPLGNNGPVPFVGWDNMSSLWSGGQANWGLVTDYGFNNPSNSSMQLTGSMVAPANSFFVEWYNRAQGRTYGTKDAAGNPITMPFPCSQNTSFYYQWFGLDGHKWEPVTSLTPTVQKVEGQQALSYYDGTKGAYNATNRATSTNKGNLIVPNAGSPESAQNADGSIDFGKAKKLQPELDGYFKLVTWPITTTPTTTNANGPQSFDGCLATDPPKGNSSMTIRDANNPLYNDADPSKPLGITMDTPDKEANAILAKGSTIDTVFAKYSLDRPAPPTIDNPTETYADPDMRHITGTGIPGDDVTLFREDPSKPIKDVADASGPADPDNTKSRGTRIGTVTVGSDGKWEMYDLARIDPAKQDHVRYHAWQTETTTGYDISSIFSNVVRENFNLKLNQAPTVTSVEVPHTARMQDGANTVAKLPTDSKVTIKGGYDTSRGDATIQVYMVPQTGGQLSSSSSSSGTVGSSLTVPDAKWQVCNNGAVDSTHPSIPVQGTWTCSVNPSVFSDANHTKTDGSVWLWYTVYVVLKDPTGRQADMMSQVTNQIVDMYAPAVTVDSVNRGTGLVKGSVKKTLTGVAMNGLTVSVTWPDGSTGTATTDSTGAWQMAIPGTMRPGDIQAVTVDHAEKLEKTNNVGSVATKGNESAPALSKLTGSPLVSHLPLTGQRPLIFLVALLVVLVTIGGYLVAKRIRSSVIHKGAHVNNK